MTVPYVEANGVRMTEDALARLLQRVFWKQTRSLETMEQCEEAARVGARFLMAVGRDGYFPEQPGVTITQGADPESS